VKVALGLAVLILVAGAAPAWGQASRTADDIAGQVMSPFCDGLTLRECPSEPATKLRARIEGWVEAGWSRARIMARLEDLYGPGILGGPPTGGAGLLAWGLPGAVLVAGAGLAWALARRWSARTIEVAELDERGRSRVRAELARRREASRLEAGR
jgi:cytochrome c-type biogenesis protein CcmH/NrfF